MKKLMLVAACAAVLVGAALVVPVEAQAGLNFIIDDNGIVVIIDDNGIVEHNRRPPSPGQTFPLVGIIDDNGIVIIIDDNGIVAINPPPTGCSNPFEC